MGTLCAIVREYERNSRKKNKTPPLDAEARWSIVNPAQSRNPKVGGGSRPSLRPFQAGYVLYSTAPGFGHGALKLPRFVFHLLSAVSYMTAACVSPFPEAQGSLACRICRRSLPPDAFLDWLVSSGGLRRVRRLRLDERVLRRKPGLPDQSVHASDARTSSQPRRVIGTTS